MKLEQYQQIARGMRDVDSALHLSSHSTGQQRYFPFPIQTIIVMSNLEYFQVKNDGGFTAEALQNKA